MAGQVRSIISRWIEWAASFGTSSTTPESSFSSSSSSSKGAEADIKRLARLLGGIQAVLNDAEEKEIHEDSAVKYWLKELRLVAYDVDDVLVEYDYYLQKAQIEHRDAHEAASRKRKAQVMEQQQQQRQEEVSDLFIPPHSFPIPDGLQDRIRKITDEFDQISKDRVALSLRADEAPMKSNAPTFDPPPSTSIVDESSVYGRDEDKEEIINMVLSESSNSSQDLWDENVC